MSRGPDCTAGPSAFHDSLPVPVRVVLTTQPRWGSRSAAALPRLKTSPVPPGGPTRHCPPSRTGSTSVSGCTGGTVVPAPAMVVVVAPGTVVVVAPGAAVVDAAVVVGGAVLAVVAVVGGAAARAEPANPDGVASGTALVPGAVLAGAAVVGDAADPTVVLPGAVPATVLPGAVPLGVVVDAPGSAAAKHWYTGRSVTMPATSTASRASSWSRTPGRSTMMLGPSTRTSGSAMPRRSSSSRIRSRMTSRSSSVAPSLGARVTDKPPCRSRPRAGVLPKARLSASTAAVTPTMPATHAHSRRRIIGAPASSTYASCSSPAHQ